MKKTVMGWLSESKVLEKRIEKKRMNYWISYTRCLWSRIKMRTMMKM